MPQVSIVIPTIAGREHWLKRGLKAFSETTNVTYETIVIYDRPTCGIAWNDGFEKAAGDYILFSADDLEPLDGWFEAGVACLEKGAIPAARILNSDGSLQCMGDWIEEMQEGIEADLCRIPFGSREMVEKIFPMIETHYATDNWFSHRARQNGWPTIIARDFCFYHHWATQGRLDDRLSKDIFFYRRAAGLRVDGTQRKDYRL